MQYSIEVRRSIQADHPWPYLWCCIALFFLLAISISRADEGSAPILPDIERGETVVTPGLNQRVDNWYALMSAVIADPFDRVDRFFGDETIADEGRRTRLRVGAGVRTDVVRGWRMVTDFSLRMALPRIEERLQIFLDELSGDDELEGLQTIARPPVDTEPDIGLRYFLLRDVRTSISADAGYRFGSPNQAFGRIRGRARYPRKRWSLNLTQTATFFTNDGWRSQSDMSWTLPFAMHYGFRSFSRMTVEDRSDGVTPEQRFSLYRTLTEQRAWRLEGGGVWEELPEASNIKYSYELIYRQLLYRNWFFVELGAGADYTESRDYAANPFVSLKFEILFNTD